MALLEKAPELLILLEQAREMTQTAKSQGRLERVFQLELYSVLVMDLLCNKEREL
jgi:hypothetical protein